mgnify:FL=1
MTACDFKEMISVVENLYYWECETDGTILDANAPEEMQKVLHALFLQSAFPEKIRDYSRTSDVPYAMGMFMGLEWFVVLKKQADKLERFYLIGPVFFAPVGREQLELFLQDYEKQGMSFHSRHVLIGFLENLPVIFQKYFTNYALMLDQVVNGRRLSYGQVNSHVRDLVDENRQTLPTLYRKSRLSLAEMMGHLQMGDLSVLREKSEVQKTDFVILPSNAAGIREPLRTLKDSALIFTGKCADAAVAGGLSPEIADALADSYMGQIEKDLSGVEIMHLMGRIYEDYLRRVHEVHRKNENYTPKIKDCLEYIDLHICERLDVTALAQVVGYSDYYLSRLFYREVGERLPSYIRLKKIAYAAMLLRTTDLDIGQIAERLSFCSASHFSDAFARQMGCSPSVYRGLQQ